MERVEDLLGRTDIVHDHFKELFTDPLHKETPGWIWPRWPQEVLQFLPLIDNQSRKRTSCAEDHLVIEMLSSWTETFGKLLQSAFSWTEDDDMLWARQLVTMVRKILQQLAGQAMRTRRSPQYGHVPGRQAHEDAWWNKLLSGRYQFL